MIVMMSGLLETWIRWREDQSDAELPEAFRFQENEVNVTFSVLSSALFVGLIAIVDFLIPANYIVAILYAVPLFICSRTGKQWLIWPLLVIVLFLTAGALLWGPAPSISFETVARNRALTGLAMVTMTGILAIWIRENKALNS